MALRWFRVLFDRTESFDRTEDEDDRDMLEAELRTGPAGQLAGATTKTETIGMHPNIRKSLVAVPRSRVPYRTVAWPLAGGVKVLPPENDGLVWLCWLVRVKGLFHSKDSQIHASRFFKVKLPGSEEPRDFQLQLAPASRDFRASNGRGKVQIRSRNKLPEHLSELRVKILAGRVAGVDHNWRGPKVASFKREKALFELEGEEWDFKEFLDEQGHLPIVVELGLPE